MARPAVFCAGHLTPIPITDADPTFSTKRVLGNDFCHTFMQKRLLLYGEEHRRGKLEFRTQETHVVV
jgi:hypothetical protein